MFSIIKIIKSRAQSGGGAARKDHTVRGFTLVETIFYAAGLVVLLGAMTGFLYYMYDWYRNVTIAPRADRVGTATVDRMVREIRTASSMNVAGSVFNSSNGVISVTVSTSTGNTTKVFALNNNCVTYVINSGASECLSSSDITVSALYINRITTPISQAVRIDLRITYQTKSGPQTRDYVGLAILRASY